VLAGRNRARDIDRMTARYAIRPDATGFSVYDLRTGEPVILASTPQRGLSEQDAQHTAELLNTRAPAGDQVARG